MKPSEKKGDKNGSEASYVDILRIHDHLKNMNPDLLRQKDAFAIDRSILFLQCSLIYGAQIRYI